jgi:hypothetical protein
MTPLRMHGRCQWCDELARRKGAAAGGLIAEMKIWLERAKITEGAIVRWLIGADQIGGALNPGSIR